MNRLASLRFVILAPDSLLSSSERIPLHLSGRDAFCHHKKKTLPPGEYAPKSNLKNFKLVLR